MEKLVLQAAAHLSHRAHKGSFHVVRRGIKKRVGPSAQGLDGKSQTSFWSWIPHLLPRETEQGVPREKERGNVSHIANFLLKPGQPTKLHTLSQCSPPLASWELGVGGIETITTLPWIAGDGGSSRVTGTLGLQNPHPESGLDRNRVIVYLGLASESVSPS